MTGSGRPNKGTKADRSQRLAAALRENLRKRKAQERGRNAPETRERVEQPERPGAGKQKP